MLRSSLPSGNCLAQRQYKKSLSALQEVIERFKRFSFQSATKTKLLSYQFYHTKKKSWSHSSRSLLLLLLSQLASGTVAKSLIWNCIPPRVPAAVFQCFTSVCSRKLTFLSFDFQCHPISTIRFPRATWSSGKVPTWRYAAKPPEAHPRRSSGSVTITRKLPSPKTTAVR